ncbi:STAS domain-containing protein [uncultured Jatrophihabitans sp.]|uniref:STAS domain-containing protein n=1 Tax=uncultured Jatrophihabitans sp. TaxID=1610747 RepID=UPI0035CC086B
MSTATPNVPRTNARKIASALPNRDWLDHRRRDTALAVETIAADPQGATVKARGHLDLGTAPPLWAVLRSHLRSGRRFLRLDVSALGFVDASALAALREIHDEALIARGTLVVTGVGALVERVLHLTALDDVLFLGGRRSEHDTRPLIVD